MLGNGGAEIWSATSSPKESDSTLATPEGNTTLDDAGQFRATKGIDSEFCAYQNNCTRRNGSQAIWTTAAARQPPPAHPTGTSAR